MYHDKGNLIITLNSELQSYGNHTTLKPEKKKFQFVVLCYLSAFYQIHCNIWRPFSIFSYSYMVEKTLILGQVLK